MQDILTLSNNIRIESLKMVHRSGASHIGSALSIADILAVLYGYIMQLDPQNDLLEDRDRFILSKGHSCVALYAVLAELNFFNKKELENYGKDFSILMNHVSHKVKGVEFSTGSLGHGLSFGIGKALVANLHKLKWNTYVLMSDGELDEGSNWEGILFAGHHKLSNLTAIVDYNKIQSLTSVKNTLGLEPLGEKFKSFQWEVLEVDGHNHNELIKAFKENTSEKPKVILAHTIKGKGISFMEGKVKWHYENPSDSELERALEELNA